MSAAIVMTADPPDPSIQAGSSDRPPSSVASTRRREGLMAVCSTRPTAWTAIITRPRR